MISREFEVELSPSSRLLSKVTFPLVYDDIRFTLSSSFTSRVELRNIATRDVPLMEIPRSRTDFNTPMSNVNASSEDAVSIRGVWIAYMVDSLSVHKKIYNKIQSNHMLLIIMTMSTERWEGWPTIPYSNEVTVFPDITICNPEADCFKECPDPNVRSLLAAKVMPSENVAPFSTVSVVSDVIVDTTRDPDRIVFPPDSSEIETTAAFDPAPNCKDDDDLYTPFVSTPLDANATLVRLELVGAI